MARLRREQFRFRKHETVGAEGAEQDSEFLYECYVDTGDLDVLRDPVQAPSIVVGRTGVGKTALLMMLRQYEENVAWIEPDQLSLQYLSNSTILRRLEELGVNLDIFYRLLWRHIFAVELIQLKYKIRSESDQKNFLQRITENFFGDKKKTDALAYLVEWGQHFWEDTEYRIHEVTEKLEKDVKASLGAKANILEAGVSASGKLSAEDKKEIVHRAQQIVNGVQIQKLAKILDALAEDVFSDPAQRFYVVIDRLDEQWIEENLRYPLIRALIEAVRDFQRFRTVKIVIALRKDLLDRVFRETQDAGFQEEKYQALLLRVQWSAPALMSVLNNRIQKLVSRQYMKTPVGWKDLFPDKIGKESSEEYILKRTLYRPRDIVQFANSCIDMAVDRSEITVSMVREAESRYSTLRFRSLGDEWAADYPGLLIAANILKNRPWRFPLASITESDVEKCCLEAFDNDKFPTGSRIAGWVQEVMENNLRLGDFKIRLVKMFYDVGLVGVRPGTKARTSWAFLDREVLREAEIQNDVVLEICPMVFRVLGIDTRRARKSLSTI